MKKLCCILMVITMLCSLLVVNASAANTYEYETFKINSDYEIDFSGGSINNDTIEVYNYFCYIEDLDSEIEITIADMDYMLEEIPDDYPEVNTSKEYYQIYRGYYSDSVEVLIDGIPAFTNTWGNTDTYFIWFWSDNYCYEIVIKAVNEETRDTIYDLIIEGFEITDSTSWYVEYTNETSITNKTDDLANADNKVDRDAKADENTDSNKIDDNTVIVVAIVVGGVVILGVTAIVVLGKRKKQ